MKTSPYAIQEATLPSWQKNFPAATLCVIFAFLLNLTPHHPFYFYHELPLSWFGITVLIKGLGITAIVMAFFLLVGKSIARSLPRFEIRILAGSVVCFTILCALSYPYTFPLNPLAMPSGLASIGRFYSEMSSAPFSESNEFVFRRVLIPLIGYLTQLTGDRYFFLSLFGSALVCFATCAFLQPRGIAWIAALSLLTSSSVMNGLQSPGYPESFGFVVLIALISLRTTIPERLAMGALCLAIHDGLIFPFLAMIWTLGPPRDRWKTTWPLLTYFIFFVGLNCLGLENPLQGHHIIGEYSRRELWAARPGIALFGVFLSFKLLWLPICGLMIQDFRKPVLLTLQKMRIPVLLGGGAALLFLAWDVSRLMGFAYIAALIGTHNLSRKMRFSAIAVCCLNLLIPSYSVELNLWKDPERKWDYPYPGIYRWIHLHTLGNAKEPSNN